MESKDVVGMPTEEDPEEIKKLPRVKLDFLYASSSQTTQFLIILNLILN